MVVGQLKRRPYAFQFAHSRPYANTNILVYKGHKKLHLALGSECGYGHRCVENIVKNDSHASGNHV